MKNGMCEEQKKLLKAAVACTVVLILCWGLFILTSNELYSNNLDTLVWAFCLVAIVTAIVSPGLWIVFIVGFIRRKKKSKISGFIIFAIVDIIMMLLTAAYAIYDINTSTSYFFAGLAGLLMLVYLEPIMLGMLIIDIVVGCIHKKKHSKIEHDGVMKENEIEL